MTDSFCKVSVFGAILICISAIRGEFIEDDGLGELADAFGDLFSEMTECDFKCPNGVDPITNPKHTPTSNGCGSYGIKLESDSVPGMTQCCDTHDICYDTCGSNKNKCDKEFKACLEKTCDKNKKQLKKEKHAGCKATAKLLYGGTTILGCEAYKASQMNACLCSGKSKSKKKGMRYKTEL